MTLWSGYWLAKRRLNLYAVQQETCLVTSFVWDKDNTTSGQLAEMSWESQAWLSGSPDCTMDYPLLGMFETCCHVAVYHEYTINDISCWYPQCPVCQINANWSNRTLVSYVLYRHVSNWKSTAVIHPVAFGNKLLITFWNEASRVISKPWFVKKCLWFDSSIKFL